MTAERRLTDRCRAHLDQIQVSIHPNQNLYSVKNISKAGLAIEYRPIKDEVFESETIDIIAVDYDRFYLPDIACKTVYDIATLMEGQLFSGGERRIRGLKFVGLTKEQEDRLDHLLELCFDRYTK
jgi:hypothetical protein